MYFVGTIRVPHLKNCPLMCEKGLQKQNLGTFDHRVEINHNIVAVWWLDNRAVTLVSSFVGVHPVEEISRFIGNQKMSLDLNDKVALITGASSGIGAGTAIYFAKLGVRLSLTGRKERNLNEIAKKCKEASPDKVTKPLVMVADLLSEEDTKRVVDNTIEHFKRLDILVNSAGIIQRGDIETLSLSDFDKQMNINVRSVFHITQLATPHLVSSKGNVVNVSSVTGLRSFPGVNSYCMSKAAIDQFTRCTALELASKQVRVNAVNPGVIKTEVHLRSGVSEENYKKFLENCKDTHALGRYGEVEEVASVIAFLASDGASFITGATIPVDGGRHAMCPR